jgi:hypothetical protein
MKRNTYVHCIEDDGEYSMSSALESLAAPGYLHANFLMAQGATPRAVTIDGHFILELNGETWVVDAPRSGGRVERIAQNWQSVAGRVEANEPVSDVIGWDEESDS